MDNVVSLERSNSKLGISFLLSRSEGIPRYSIRKRSIKRQSEYIQAPEKIVWGLL